MQNKSFYEAEEKGLFTFYKQQQLYEQQLKLSKEYFSPNSRQPVKKKQISLNLKNSKNKQEFRKCESNLKEKSYLSSIFNNKKTHRRLLKDSHNPILETIKSPKKQIQSHQQTLKTKEIKLSIPHKTDQPQLYKLAKRHRTDMDYVDKKSHQLSRNVFKLQETLQPKQDQKRQLLPVVQPIKLFLSKKRYYKNLITPHRKHTLKMAPVYSKWETFDDNRYNQNYIQPRMRLDFSQQQYQNSISAQILPILTDQNPEFRKKKVQRETIDQKIKKNIKTIETSRASKSKKYKNFESKMHLFHLNSHVQFLLIKEDTPKKDAFSNH